MYRFLIFFFGKTRKSGNSGSATPRSKYWLEPYFIDLCWLLSIADFQFCDPYIFTMLYVGNFQNKQD